MDSGNCYRLRKTAYFPAFFLEKSNTKREAVTFCTGAGSGSFPY